MIGICGGVGPAAGILLHQTILQHTESRGIDQGHLNVCHFSCSADISSRVDFLLQQKDPSSSPSNNGATENPACGMARTFEMMAAAARAAQVPLVAGVPCITFHVDPIWNEFRKRISIDEDDGAANVKCLHMLEETVRFLSELAPSCQKVGVMCTNGTREARVFNDLLEPLGYNVLEVSDETQRQLQETIQNPQWGIKSNAPFVHQKCIDNFHSYARALIASGAQVIILGCTEIPFVFGGASLFEGALILDPLVALSRALIRESDPSRLKPLVLNGRRQP